MRRERRGGEGGKSREDHHQELERTLEIMGRGHRKKEKKMSENVSSSFKRLMDSSMRLVITDKEKALLRATGNGDIGTLTSLIQMGVSPNVYQEEVF